MTSSDRCSLYLHRFGAFEMSLSNTLWKMACPGNPPQRHSFVCRSFFCFFVVVVLFYVVFSLVPFWCQCNVYWTWCSIKRVNRVDLNFICVVHFRWEHAQGSSSLDLFSVTGSQWRCRTSGSTGCNTHWTEDDASNLRKYRGCNLRWRGELHL